MLQALVMPTLKTYGEHASPVMTLPGLSASSMHASNQLHDIGVQQRP